MNSSSNKSVIYLLHFYFCFNPKKGKKRSKTKWERSPRQYLGFGITRGKGRNYKSSASQTSDNSYGYHTGAAIFVNPRTAPKVCCSLFRVHGFGCYLIFIYGTCFYFDIWAITVSIRLTFWIIASWLIKKKRPGKSEGELAQCSYHTGKTTQNKCLRLRPRGSQVWALSTCIWKTCNFKNSPSCLLYRLPHLLQREFERKPYVPLKKICRTYL